MSDTSENGLEAISNCLICGATTRPVFRKNGYSIVDCGDCGHRFSADPLKTDHVATTYNDTYFFGGGAGYDDYLTEAGLLKAQGLRYGDLLKRHAPTGRLLDVGCAAGFLQAGFAEKGWTTKGLDPNATMIAHAREKLGLDAEQGSLESPPQWDPFDAVCLIQVIGHFHDLPKAMQSVRNLTKHGGLCLVEYWRRDSQIARLLGRNWHEYSPPSVLHWFSQPSLDGLMARFGFHSIGTGKPRKYISGGHARSLLGYKLSQMPFGKALATSTQLIPPDTRIRYPAMDLQWRLYRRGDDRQETANDSTARGA